VDYYIPLGSRILGFCVLVNFLICEKSSLVLKYYDKIPHIGWLVLFLSIFRVFFYAPLVSIFLFNSIKSINFLWVKAGVFDRSQDNFFFAGENSVARMGRTAVDIAEELLRRSGQRAAGGSGQVPEAAIKGADIIIAGGTVIVDGYAAGSSQKADHVEKMQNASRALHEDLVRGRIEERVAREFGEKIAKNIETTNETSPILIGISSFTRSAVNPLFPDVNPNHPVLAEGQQLVAEVVKVGFGG
jgi:hypothetical protein